MAVNHCIEWKPMNVSAHGVFCKRCDCFLALARYCRNRDDFSFLFQPKSVVNIYINNSNKLLICRCDSNLGYAMNKDLFYLDNIVGRDIKNELFEDDKQLLFEPIIHIVPKNGFYYCPGCLRIICVKSFDILKNNWLIPAYLAPNIKMCNNDSEDELNSAMCFCGFIVGEFINDNEWILDSIYESNNLNDSNHKFEMVNTNYEKLNKFENEKNYSQISLDEISDNEWFDDESIESSTKSQSENASFEMSLDEISEDEDFDNNNIVTSSSIKNSMLRKTRFEISMDLISK